MPVNNLAPNSDRPPFMSFSKQYEESSGTSPEGQDANPVRFPPPSSRHGSGAPAPGSGVATGAREPTRLPRIAIFEKETKSVAVQRARERTVVIVDHDHSLARRTTMELEVPLPNSTMDERTKQEQTYRRKLFQNRISAEVSRERNRVYIAELERELEEMEKERNAAKAELESLTTRLHGIVGPGPAVPETTRRGNVSTTGQSQHGPSRQDPNFAENFSWMRRG